MKNLLVKSMERWRTELTSFGEGLAEVRLRRRIFQGDALSPLLFVTALIPMTLVLKKARSLYKFKNGEKIVHLLFMADLKLYAMLRAREV